MSDDLKRLAAEKAVSEIESGMVLGLGSGSTVEIALELLGQRVAGGLSVVGIPTSTRTAELATELGIALTHFSEHRRIDLTIDGADEVERGSLHLIKGGGAALLREKIVAAASDRLIIMADESKLVDRLGHRWAIPIEVVPFGHQATVERLSAFGDAKLRTKEGKPLVTDNGNFIVDCQSGEIDDPTTLERELDRIVGVVESGLFIDMAELAIIGGRDGVSVLQRYS